MRDVQESVKCDAPGCRRQPGSGHEHIELAVTYRANPADVPEGTAVPPIMAHEVLDFCSWEHAVKGLGEFGRGAEKRRDAALEVAKQQAEERSQYEERVAAAEKARQEDDDRAEAADGDEVEE